MGTIVLFLSGFEFVLWPEIGNHQVLNQRYYEAQLKAKASSFSAEMGRESGCRNFRKLVLSLNPLTWSRNVARYQGSALIKDFVDDSVVFAEVLWQPGRL
jgi:hypothetical protein